MYNLIIDSSTKILYVALVDENNILFEKYIEGRNDHAKNIVKTVDDALKSANIDAFKLDKVIVGYGPGSYTGVRMAVTVAKMLAIFANVKLYTISTLRLMQSAKKGVVKATIDARRGNAFASVFDMDKNEYVIKEGLYSYEELKDYQEEVKEDNFKVNPFYVVLNSNEVSEPHLLVPNYLRDTEAERNLKWLED